MGGFCESTTTCVKAAATATGTITIRTRVVHVGLIFRREVEGCGGFSWIADK